MYTRKILAVFISVLLVTSIFSFISIIGAQNVSAASFEGTCAVKAPNVDGSSYCREDLIESQCNSTYDWFAGLHRTDSQVTLCKNVTCIPSDNSECVDNVYKIKCTEEGGQYFQDSKSNVPECDTICCNVAGNSCGLKERHECSGTITEGQTRDQCENACKAQKVGCCKLATGYVTKTIGECTQLGGTPSDFYCSALPEVQANPCSDIMPGSGIISNDKNDCYCYDSKGNQEGIATTADYSRLKGSGGGGIGSSGDCTTYDQRCVDSDGPKGDVAECKTTSCVEDCTDCSPTHLKLGESVCLNVMPGHFTPTSKSKYLKNYILSCQPGEIQSEIVALEKDNQGNQFTETRNSVCIESQTSGFVEAKGISNNWNECLSCSPQSVFDIFGYVPLIGPPVADTLGGICKDGGQFETGTNCEEKGKVGNYKMCNPYDYDLGSPLGSCNPKYPPGEDHCADCGRGGDELTNVCTEEECNAMGDCEFKSGLTAESMISTGLMLGGTCVAAYVLATLYSVFSSGSSYSVAASICQGTIGAGGGIPAYVGMAYMAGVSIFGSINSDPRDFSTAELKDGDKVKLGYAAVTAKKISTEISGDVNSALAGISGAQGYTGYKSETTGQALLPPLIGAVAEFTAKDIAIKDWPKGIALVIQREIEKYALISNPATYPAVINYLAKDTTGELTKKLGIDLTKKAADKTAEAFIAEGLKGKTAKEIQDAVGKDALDTLKKESVDTAKKKVTESASTHWYSKVSTWLNVVGAVLAIYFTAKAINPGDCAPESKYAGNEHCSDCGPAEGQWSCTKNRCEKILGNCKWVGYDGKADDGICFPLATTDTTAPVMKKINVTFYDYLGKKISMPTGLSNPYVENGNVMDISAKPLQWNTTNITIEVETDEGAKCWYGKEQGAAITETGKMALFDVETLYPSGHKVSNIALEGGGKTDYEFIIKCQDVNGNVNGKNDDRNKIKFSLAEPPDENPPTYIWHRPLNINVPANTNTITLAINAYDKNGVKECRYSNYTAEWANMLSMARVGTTKTRSCEPFLRGINKCDEFSKSISLSGDEIDSSIGSEIVKVRSNKFYIKCKDNWDNEGLYIPDLQVIQDNITVALNVVPSFTLNVNSPKANEIYFDFFKVNATTSRNSFCEYNLTKSSNLKTKLFLFNDQIPGNAAHTRDNVEGVDTEKLTAGSYTVKVRCHDDAGNTVESEAIPFEDQDDMTAPKMVRAYKDSFISTLRIITDEPSLCVYSTDSSVRCAYNYSDGTAMPTSKIYPSTLSSAEWDITQTYYIKCADNHPNYPGGSSNANVCTAVIKPYSTSACWNVPGTFPGLGC